MLSRRLFYDKRIAMEVPAEQLGDEYAGYIFRIMGGEWLSPVLLCLRAFGTCVDSRLRCQAANGLGLCGCPGNDKQGFPMKQGVMLDHRIKLLLQKGHSCYRPRRKGERKRKSVRCGSACIFVEVFVSLVLALLCLDVC